LGNELRIDLGTEQVIDLMLEVIIIVIITTMAIAITLSPPPILDNILYNSIFIVL
jgi:hypothetical protein